MRFAQLKEVMDTLSQSRMSESKLSGQFGQGSMR